MNSIRNFRLTRLRLILAAAVLAVAGLSAAWAGQAASANTISADTTAGPKPAIVLEHGAWADSSSWNGVIGRLHADGYTVYAPPDPLRGLAYDAATLADFLKTIHGPVILVGHSYGGAVITNAAVGNPDVKALVYVDAYIPAKGDTVFGLTAARPGSCLAGNPADIFRVASYPGAPSGDADAYLNTATSGSYPGFADCFANGLPAQQAATLAATQRPITLSAGSTPSGTPAWKTIPSWALLGTADHVIPLAEQLFMAHRAHAQVTEINAGHLSLISCPDAVTRLIVHAAQTTS